MSLDIDHDKKYSDKEVQYLRDRDQWRLLLANFERFGGEKPVLPGEAPQTGPESNVNRLGPTALTREQERASLQAALAALDEQEAEEVIPYEKLTVPELRAELDGRKAEAATDEEKANLEYTAKDKKDELVARLDKDDELVESRP